MFSFRLKLDVRGQVDEIILEVAGQEGGGFLKIGQFSWTWYVYRPLEQRNIFLWLENNWIPKKNHRLWQK